MNLKDLSKRPSSLAFRVTILVGLTIFVCLTFISLMVQQSIAQHFEEQDADELNEVFLAVKRKLNTAYNEGSHRLAYYSKLSLGITVSII